MIRQTITKKSDVITFGKHKGKTIREIILHKPSYILWLHENEIVSFPKRFIEDAKIEDGNQSPPEDFYWQPD